MKQFILIDDDNLICLGWKYQAQKSNVDLLIFNSVSQFLNSSKNLSKDSLIYIDSNLKNEGKGEILAEMIFKAGFNNITLATGYDDIDITLYPWLSGVTTKTPPF